MSEETHPGEAQTSVGTPDYMGKARELADSYPQLLARKQELKRQIDESHAWFYTRDEVIYKLSQGAHEQGERSGAFCFPRNEPKRVKILATWDFSHVLACSGTRRSKQQPDAAKTN